MVRVRAPRQKSDLIRIKDYNVDAPSSGYRAVHIVVRREGALVEVQLRTFRQQLWADLVEELDKAYRLNLKNEEGPIEVLDYLRTFGSSLAMIERTGAIDPELVRLVGGLREQAQRRLADGGTG